MHKRLKFYLLFFPVVAVLFFIFIEIESKYPIGVLVLILTGINFQNFLSGAIFNFSWIRRLVFVTATFLISMYASVILTFMALWGSGVQWTYADETMALGCFIFFIVMFYEGYFLVTRIIEGSKLTNTVAKKEGRAGQKNLLLFGEESSRLFFRTLEPGDFDTWLQFFKNPLWNKYWHTEDLTPEENCKRWFAKAFFRYQNNFGGMNVLIDKKSGEFIGQCGLLLQSVDNLNEIEVAYSMMPRHWNKGYATEAAKRCIDYAFANNLADSVISIIHENNVESEKVALKNGLFLDKRTTYDDNPVKIYRILKRA